LMQSILLFFLSDYHNILALLLKEFKMVLIFLKIQTKSKKRFLQSIFL
jgi:hypothetical protein